MPKIDDDTYDDDGFGVDVMMLMVMMMCWWWWYGWDDDDEYKGISLGSGNMLPDL